MGDFVKTNDQQLRAQLQLFKDVVTPLAAAYGLTVSDMSGFGSGLSGFIDALDDHVAAQEFAKSKTESKDLYKASIVDMYRGFAAVIQADKTVTPAMISAAGLPVHSSTRSPSGIPDSRPVIEVADVEGGRHVLRTTDSATGKRARPADAAKLILYRKVVAAGQPAPAGLDEMEQVNAYTTSKVVLTYDGGAVGKTVYYGACYANVKNEAGPTSTIVSATVAA